MMKENQIDLTGLISHKLRICGGCSLVLSLVKICGNNDFDIPYLRTHRTEISVMREVYQNRRYYSFKCHIYLKSCRLPQKTVTMNSCRIIFQV